MALNWTMLNPDRTPVPLPRETFITTIDTGIELSLTVPNTLPTASSTSGGSGGAKKLKDNGKLFLSDQRVGLSYMQLVFVSLASEGTPATLQSLSIPLHSILSSKFEQPYLGANYLALDINPSAEGGLAEGTTAEIRFKNQGLFQFVSLLEKTRERSIYMRRQALDDEETLPAYASPSRPPSSQPVVVAPPEDTPPGYDA
ncbi:hypothetical protein EVG20_g9209 [Dentipellis fragilis]|uniref:Uncharacterized protein n=1 Tax=Dentipellis fragilis TaxID=205917 RepID=A0A4Y9XZZ8_9AGAM|nr:hypothetical protein EVG20_g9209 [Dentipellis fragilis]